MKKKKKWNKYPHSRSFIYKICSRYIVFIYWYIKFLSQFTRLKLKFFGWLEDKRISVCSNSSTSLLFCLQKQRKEYAVKINRSCFRPTNNTIGWELFENIIYHLQVFENFRLLFLRIDCVDCWMFVHKLNSIKWVLVVRLHCLIMLMIKFWTLTRSSRRSEWKLKYICNVDIVYNKCTQISIKRHFNCITWIAGIQQE